AQLKKSIESNANIIWCTRGGYGSADLLPFLQKMRKPKKPKIFIGFSDITSLNIFLIQNWGWQVISAPMLIQLALAMVSKKSEQAILDLVFSQKPSIPLTTSYHLPLTPITGGCLSVLCSHFGTKNQIDWQGKVLFLEDEGEDGERLDRYFTQIATIIRETKKTPKAILLGNFLEANPHGTPKAKNIEIALKRFAEKLPKKILILSEKSFGHGKDMMPLVLR
ncbi:MAG: LD-carboxypeptidase, partial [Alphaproteobacteria bacterium]|nr:LD-carboxypeptidase [Alphaproteobacteria bacterium]